MEHREDDAGMETNDTDDPMWEVWNVAEIRHDDDGAVDPHGNVAGVAV